MYDNCFQDAIPKISRLPNLTVVQLTFLGEEILDSDELAIAAARKALLATPAKGKKELLIRRVIAPRYTNGMNEDEVINSTAEVL